MVLNALRLAETDLLPSKMECSDTYFEIASAMIRVLVKHSSRVFSELPEEAKPIPRNNLKKKFLNEFPVEFNRQTYLKAGQRIGIPGHTVDRFIRIFVEKALVLQKMRDSYKKIIQEGMGILE